MFSVMFPQGHEASIRHLIERLAQPASTLTEADFFKRLTQIHPDAIPLLLAHGEDYTPKIFNDVAYREKLQPRWGQCFGNAWLIMDHARHFGKPPQSYVEGIVMGAQSFPMLHAWNTRAPSEAFDWSLYATTGWTRYFGVPLTADEYEFVSHEAYGKRNVFPLFDREYFEKHQGPLEEVLSRRIRQQEKPAA